MYFLFFCEFLWNYEINLFIFSIFQFHRFVAGVLPLDKKVSFERILWRACRRTAFVKTSEESFLINDPVTVGFFLISVIIFINFSFSLIFFCSWNPTPSVCLLCFSRESHLGWLFRKFVMGQFNFIISSSFFLSPPYHFICFSFNATQYPCPKTSKERSMKLVETEGRINDLTVVIDTTQTHRFNVSLLLRIFVKFGFFLKFLNFLKIKKNFCFVFFFIFLEILELFSNFFLDFRDFSHFLFSDPERALVWTPDMAQKYPDSKVGFCSDEHVYGEFQTVLCNLFIFWFFWNWRYFQKIFFLFSEILSLLHLIR